MNTTKLEAEQTKPVRKATRRRKRDARESVTGKRLAVRTDMLDFTKFAYRWINDDPARLHSKTKEDDWDIVTNKGGKVKNDSSDLGSAVSMIVGTQPDGSPKRAYLCRKPKTYFDDDQKDKQSILDQQLEQLRRGNSREGEANSDYVPHSGISL